MGLTGIFLETNQGGGGGGGFGTHENGGTVDTEKYKYPGVSRNITQEILQYLLD